MTTVLSCVAMSKDVRTIVLLAVISIGLTAVGVHYHMARWSIRSLAAFGSIIFGSSVLGGGVASRKWNAATWLALVAAAVLFWAATSFRI